ncbi:beta strand repeat-containing protein [Flavobacterium sp. SM2513]|uniref:beta strand repeat-containing protein n=1 Tax=Flavobacterium sp. SM2513 TaxID=3424766 RepID=UPI003D7F5445
MKKIYLIIVTYLLFFSSLWSQTTETFETETVGSTSFTDNGRVFNITSQTNSVFDVFLFSGGGWNGSAPDNRFIDNSGSTTFNVPVQFTITAAQGTFALKSLYLFLSQSNLNFNVSGSVTITGKLGGVEKFTATANSPFNTSFGVNNGFTFINMVNFGGSNNSNSTIDQYVITTTGGYAYVALDAMSWQPGFTVSFNSQTNIACNGGATGAAAVSIANGTGPFTYDWTGTPTGDGTAAVTGLSAGQHTCTVTDANGATGSVTFNITQPAALTATTLQTNVSCNGGSNGVLSVTPSGGAGGYTYSWSPSGATTATITGRSAGNYAVTITDANGCTLQKNITLSQPSALTATTSQTNVSCNGGTNGTASVVASGGAGGYTYSWSPTGGTGATTTGRSAGNYTVTITDANSCSIQKNFTITQESALTATQSQTNVSCNGGTNGTASVVASGGAGGYTYSWSPTGGTGATTTGRAAGNYTVTITDANSCSIQKNFTITQESALTATQSQTNVSCNGGTNGTASVVASGGAGGYTYSWSPTGGTGATTTGRAAGNYTVTITDANSCSIQKNFTITQESALTATQSQTNVSCNGGTNGTASVVASGGAGGYTYSWSPTGGTGATTTGRAAGDYTVTITDANSCSIQKNFTITQESALTATTSQTNVACNGDSNGSASVNASGGAGGYTYLWSTGATSAAVTGLSSGGYSVIITDMNGCSTQKNFTITEPAALTGTVVSQTNVSCNGGSNGAAEVTVAGGSGSYTYQWSNGSTSTTLSGVQAGTYNLYAVDSNGCGFNSNFNLGTLVASITIIEPSVLVASAVIDSEVTSGGTDGALTASATGGTGSYTYLWSNGAQTASVTGLTPGTYTCTITDANGCESETSVTLNAPATAPTAFDVTGGGGICSGTTSVTIGLSDSEVGVNYQLKLNANNVGDVVAGTGTALSFGTFTASGSYTVQATNANDAGTTTMTGEAVISEVNYVVTIAQPLVPCVPGIPGSLSGVVESVESVADFTADYAPSNWIFTNTNADGNVNTTDAPASLNITSGNNDTNTSGTTDYSITIPASGTLSFNWSYTTSDEGPQYDIPQFVYNNLVTTFTDYDTDGSSTQSGTITLEVTEGATFVLRMHTTDNVAGAATVVISNFQAPQLTPVEANVLWTASNGGTIVGPTNQLNTNVSTSGTYTLTASLGDCSFSQSVVVDFENPVLINTTWNGTAWSNGIPSFGHKAIIDADLVVAQQLTTCELEITANGSLTVQPNAAVGIVGKITNNATAADFVVENNAVLTQLYDNQNVGPVTVNVTSFPLYRQDYTLWSSPVENHNLRIFSPQTIFNRFSSYDNTIGTVGDYVQEIFTTEDVLTKTFATGKGYLIRSPNNWPEYVNNTIPGVPFEGAFKGVPENGSITVPLSTVNGGLNLVGNPYPSPILISEFFISNPGIEQTIYYWRKRNGATGSGYATFNNMGFVSVQPGLTDLGTALENNPQISNGQGFFVKSTSATSLVFDNSMRGFMSNGVFLKSTPIEKHRLWLNLSNSTSTIGQTLIGYVTGATVGFDNGFDSSSFNDSPVALTSLINGGEYAIQGLELPFDAASSVALGFKTNVAGSYTISLSNFDGLFAENQDIYIKDNVTGLVHSLKESAYSFTATEGIANDRFEVVYQAMLGTDNPDMLVKNILVAVKDQSITINAGTIVMNTIELIDVAGRVVYTQNDVNATTATIEHLLTRNQMLVVRITTLEKGIVNKKIIY